MMSKIRRHPGFSMTLGALLSTAVFAGCGGEAASTGGGGQGGHGQGGDAGGAGGDILQGSGGNTPSGIDENSACATAAVEGKTLPVTMLIMFDKSGSMLENQKWAGAKAALIAFFQDPATAGLSVGLRFFPDDAPAAGCNDQACSIDACSQPLVPPGPLTAGPAADDPQQKALVDAVNSKNPKGETPMYAALGGAEAWAKTNAKVGERKTVVVLVTDGEPTTCNTDVDAIAALAKDAFESKDVLTYTIGMPGSNADQLNKIAAAGGSQQAFLAGAGSVTSLLVEALNSIQKAEISCSYELPAATEPGEEVDPDKINVNYHDGSGTFVTLPRVSGLDACPSSYGWYYDNPEKPATIQLCPTTCEQLQGNSGALVKILLGCATVVN